MLNNKRYITISISVYRRIGFKYFKTCETVKPNRMAAYVAHVKRNQLFELLTITNKVILKSIRFLMIGKTYTMQQHQLLRIEMITEKQRSLVMKMTVLRYAKNN